MIEAVLIHPPYHRRTGSGLVPPTGLAYISAYLAKGGHDHEIIDCALEFDSLDADSMNGLRSWLSERLKQSNPQRLIGIGPCTTSSIKAIKVISETCREVLPQIPLAYGGPLTMVPEQDWLFFGVLGASFVIKGDGEYSVCALLDSLQGCRQPAGMEGIQVSATEAVDPYFGDLSVLEYPRWDHFRLEDYHPSVRRDLFVTPVAPVMGSRGCAYRCSYCLSGHISKYRRRSLNDIAKELGALQSRYGVRAVIFYDDSFLPYPHTVNEELREFADLVRSHAPGMLWQIEVRPDVFSEIHSETMERAYASGCRQMNMGIEVADPDRQQVLSKVFSLAMLEKACRRAMLATPGMRLAGTFIFGGPDETERTVERTISFSTSLGLLFAHFYPLELYPGTPMYRTVFGSNSRKWYDLIEDDSCPWGEIIYETPALPKNRLMELISDAYARFYGRAEWEAIAQRLLADAFPMVSSVAASWKAHRFRIGE